MNIDICIFPKCDYFFLVFDIKYISLIVAWYFGDVLFDDVFTTFSVFLTRMSSVWVYWEVLSKSLRFPIDVYTHGSKLFNGIFWPFVIVVSLPTQIILGKFYLLFDFEIIGCLILLWLVSKF